MYVLQLSKKLNEDGNDVTVYTSNHANISKHEKIDGIDIFRFKMLFNPLNNPICPGFFAIMKNLNDFDIINVHNEHGFVTFVSCLLNLYVKKPIVLTCHGQLIFGNVLKDSFEKIYNMTIGKLLFKMVDTIIANSEGDKEYIISLGIDPSKIIVLSNAINMEHMDKVYKREIDAIKISQVKNKDKDIILFVGQVIKRKGIDYLLRSFSEVKKINSNAFLYIIGDGYYRKDAELFAKKLNVGEHVSFFGRVSESKLIASYNSSSIFVLPSLSEVCPTVILEAMYSGLPVITTDIPGINDHFRHFAEIVPARNDKELAKAIIKLLNDKNLRHDMGKKGKDLVKEKYTWDVVSKLYLDVYSKIFNLKKKKKYNKTNNDIVQYID
jgi:glycosyltransferase involved in cell wall biosynthesis